MAGGQEAKKHLHTHDNSTDEPQIAIQKKTLETILTCKLLTSACHKSFVFFVKKKKALS